MGILPRRRSRDTPKTGNLFLILSVDKSKKNKLHILGLWQIAH